MDNADTVISNIKAQIVDVILLAVPVLIMIVCIWTFMAFDRRRWWVNLIGAAGTALVYATTLFVMWAVDSDVYSPYNLYKEYTSVDLSVEKLGVMESFVVDVREGIAGIFPQKYLFQQAYNYLLSSIFKFIIFNKFENILF